MLFGPVFLFATAWVALGMVLWSLAFAAPALCQQWERLGPPGGMVTSLAAASDGTVYLGTPDGHVFASDDRGGHWELRGRAGDRLDGVAQRMVVDARNPDRILAAVWFRGTSGGGLFESVDGAKKWKPAGLGSEAARTLEQSSADRDVWIAGTRSGAFRSTDNAKSWQRITPADDPELQNIDSLAIDPRDAQTIYVGTYHLPWKTIDGGKSWHAISRGMIDDSDVMSLRIDARNPQRIFSSACSGIYRSEDGGASWTKLQGIPYSSRRTQQIVQDPVDGQALYAATTEGLWVTSDYGETWRRVTTRDTDANAAVVLPFDRGKVLLAGTSKQGILRSDDGGASFVESNNGFAHRVVTSAAMAIDGRDVLIQTEGSPAPMHSRDGGKTWTQFAAPGLRGPVQRIFFASTTWWTAFFDGGLAKFDRSLQRWQEVPFREVKAQPRSGRPTGKRGVTPLLKPRVNFLAESAGQLVASSGGALWVFDTRKSEFRKAAAKSLPFPVTYLSSAGEGSLLAVAAGALWSSENSGGWKRVEAPAATTGPLWVHRPSGFNGQMLLGSRDGVFAGQEYAWGLLSRGLPSIASLAAACAEPHCLIAMSNGGLYESEDGLETWRRVDSDGERGKVNEILVQGMGTFLVASEQEGMLRLSPKGSLGARPEPTSAYRRSRSRADETPLERYPWRQYAVLPELATVLSGRS